MNDDQDLAVVRSALMTMLDSLGGAHAAASGDARSQGPPAASAARTVRPGGYRGHAGHRPGARTAIRGIQAAPARRPVAGQYT